MYDRRTMANTSKIVKKANKHLVLDTIKVFECVTVEGIINHTGMSRPTVLNILKELTEQELVIKSGFAHADVGRQPMLYSINANGYVAIGIDVDSPPVILDVANLNGEPIYTAAWDIEKDQPVDEIIEVIVENINKAILETGISRERIIGIGLGLPAVINVRKNKAVRISRIKGWIDVAVDKIIQEKTGIDVFVRNDAHLLSIAEYSIQKEFDNMLYLVHRAGIGMSVILKGKLYEGSMGNAGYIGHTVLVPNGNQCDCGNKGCFETYCSKRAITEEYQQKTGHLLPYREIVEMAKEQNTIAGEIFVNAGYYLGVGISNIVKLFDIPLVVLGDMECDENHIFFKSIQKSLIENMRSFSNVQPTLIIGKLSKEQFGLGGCHFVLQRLFKSPTLKIKA